MTFFYKSWNLEFPPCTGGCIEVTVENLQLIIVSSLHGRVYRTFPIRKFYSRCFLPVWEGVSSDRGVAASSIKFPPCMGGCIVKGVFAKATFEVSSLYGRVYHYAV